jgi:peptidylprolyl isomerase
MTAKTGDTVQVHYRGTLDDGSEFDASVGRDPLSFTVGAGQVIQGFDAAVAGMEVGEKKTVRIPPQEAYGEHRDDLVVQLDRAQVPEHIDLKLGMGLQLQQPNGQPVAVTVKAIEDEHITLDANHPLAGEALTFELELVAIE